MDWKMQASLTASGELAVSDVKTGTPMVAWGPVDHLTASVAGCFVKSCAMVMEARGEKPVAVEALVVAVKADGQPSRIGSMTISYEMPGLDAEHAAKIAKDAKRICTVTNSMTCEFHLLD